jgi:hypothetical protein
MEEQLLQIDQAISHINKKLQEVTGEKVQPALMFFRPKRLTWHSPQVKLEMRLQYMKTKYFQSKKRTRCVIC